MRLIQSAETEVKLADVPDLGYFSTDQPYPRGELLARSPILIPGYAARIHLPLHILYTSISWGVALG